MTHGPPPAADTTRVWLNDPGRDLGASDLEPGWTAGSRGRCRHTELTELAPVHQGSGPHRCVACESSVASTNGSRTASGSRHVRQPSTSSALSIDIEKAASLRDNKFASGEFASVGRAMLLMELLAQSHRSLSVTEIADELGQTKTTAFRILATLQRAGYVEKDDRTSQYFLSFKVITLANTLMTARRIDDFFMPTLRDLAARTGELIRLAIAEGDSLRWIAQANGSAHRVRLQADLGDPIALHASASGKAWLSTLPQEEAMRIVLSQGLYARTPSTITNVEQFLDELKKVRTRGYALAMEEGDVGVRAAAVPVRVGSDDSRAVGTLSISGTTLTVDEERLRTIVPSLLDGAAAIAPIWGVLRSVGID
jgi:IclR family acetate operon transcriptional repressor